MKTNLLIALCFTTFILIATSSTAQTDAEDETTEIKRNEFGVGAGFVSGVGFSYRRWFENEFGLQMNLIPIKTSDFTFVSAGLTGLKTFVESESGKTRAYGYLGAHIYHVYDHYEYEDWDTGQIVVDETRETKVNMGGGVGFSFGRTISFNLMAGYGAYDVTNEFNLFPTGEIGLYFRF